MTRFLFSVLLLTGVALVPAGPASPDKAINVFKDKIETLHRDTHCCRLVCPWVGKEMSAAALQESKDKCPSCFP